jgi:hypothetical protein
MSSSENINKKSESGKKFARILFAPSYFIATVYVISTTLWPRRYFVYEFNLFWIYTIIVFISILATTIYTLISRFSLLLNYFSISNAIDANFGPVYIIRRFIPIFILVIIYWFLGFTIQNFHNKFDIIFSDGPFFPMWRIFLGLSMMYVIFISMHIWIIFFLCFIWRVRRGDI